MFSVLEAVELAPPSYLESQLKGQPPEIICKTGFGVVFEGLRPELKFAKIVPFLG
jgi:hypothetical protein